MVATVVVWRPDNGQESAGVMVSMMVWCATALFQMSLPEIRVQMSHAPCRLIVQRLIKHVPEKPTR